MNINKYYNSCRAIDKKTITGRLQKQDSVLKLKIKLKTFRF